MGISAPTTTAHRTLDTVGATASFVCAVHCVVVALFLGLSPALTMLAAPWIEWTFLSISVGVGLVALIPGYRRHGLRTPLVLFAFGISLLATLRGLLVEPSLLEMTAVVVAATSIISAHWINRGALHRCSCGPLHH